MPVAISARSSIVLSLLACVLHASARADYSVVARFDAPLGDQIRGVLTTADGGQYISLSAGGAANLGAIAYRNPQGQLSVLHSFTGADGGHPNAAVILGPDGALYGTTSTDGAATYGTAFRLALDGTFTTLHSFMIEEGGPPQTALLLAADGSFYGTTAGYYGPPLHPEVFDVLSYGAIFRLGTDGAVTVLHTFSGESDGARPLSALIEGADGALYGTTGQVADTNIFREVKHELILGTVFRIDSAGELSTLHTFEAGDPRGRLLRCGDGLYGTTTVIAGAPSSIYRITEAGSFTTLHTFASDGPDGNDTRGDLVEGAHGRLFGTTSAGLGTFFSLRTRGGLTTLHAFSAADSGPPTGSLVRAPDGSFIAATANTLAALSAQGSLQTLARTGYLNGAALSGGLTRDSDGRLYGVTVRGGAFDRGTVFQFTPGAALSVVHSFSTDGVPSELVAGSEGQLYGPVGDGGAFGLGSIVRISISGDVVTLYSFDGSQGEAPESLVRGADGALYGFTRSSGVDSIRTFFRVGLDGAATALLQLSLLESVPRLILGDDGNFYGIENGYPSFGRVYRLTPGGELSTLHAFDGADGQSPASVLVRGPDGDLYGSTALGGASGLGTLFRVSSSGDFATLYSVPDDGTQRLVFPGVNGIDADGSVYGNTINGGPDAERTLFRLNPEGSFETIRSFDPATGVVLTPFARGSDDAFYGVVNDGSVEGIFRLDTP